MAVYSIGRNIEKSGKNLLGGLVGDPCKVKMENG